VYGETPKCVTKRPRRKKTSNRKFNDNGRKGRGEGRRPWVVVVGGGDEDKDR